MHDSGKRQEFSTGAVRDTAEGKSRPDLISPIFEYRLGQWLRLGAAPKSEGGKDYGEHNWEKGIPISRYMASLKRHYIAIQEGRTDEDHECGMAFNIMAIIHTREMIRRGVLPEELDDLPNYRVPTFEHQDAEEQTKPMVGQPIKLKTYSPPAPLRVYVAGPYSAATKQKRDLNLQKAEYIGRSIMLLGHDVHVPHAATNFLHGEFSHERFMRLDLGIVAQWANSLYYIGSSPGADRELALAKMMGLRIFTDLHEVPVWLEVSP